MNSTTIWQFLTLNLLLIQKLLQSKESETRVKIEIDEYGILRLSATAPPNNTGKIWIIEFVFFTNVNIKQEKREYRKDEYRVQKDRWTSIKQNNENTDHNSLAKSSSFIEYVAGKSCWG